MKGRSARYRGAVAEYEYRAVSIPAGTDRAKTKELLQIHAEYGAGVRAAVARAREGAANALPITEDTPQHAAE